MRRLLERIHLLGMARAAGLGTEILGLGEIAGQPEVALSGRGKRNPARTGWRMKDRKVEPFSRRDVSDYSSSIECAHQQNRSDEDGHEDGNQPRDVRGQATC